MRPNKVLWLNPANTLLPQEGFHRLPLLNYVQYVLRAMFCLSWWLLKARRWWWSLRKMTTFVLSNDYKRARSLAVQYWKEITTCVISVTQEFRFGGVTWIGLIVTAMALLVSVGCRSCVPQSQCWPGCPSGRRRGACVAAGRSDRHTGSSCSAFSVSCGGRDLLRPERSGMAVDRKSVV